jgi:arginyl-tRNA synthetase
MLTRKNDAHFDFDLAKMIEQSKDNPIFYVQYAHARCCSVLRQAGVNLEELSVESLDNLTDESEIEIIKKLANFPRVIEMAVTNYEPHRIAFYLQELAAALHSLWNKGTDNPNLKFIIKDDLQLTNSRLYLILAVRNIIAQGLEIFNIKALEEMR